MEGRKEFVDRELRSVLTLLQTAAHDVSSRLGVAVVLSREEFLECTDESFSQLRKRAPFPSSVLSSLLRSVFRFIVSSAPWDDSREILEWAGYCSDKFHSIVYFAGPRDFLSEQEKLFFDSFFPQVRSVDPKRASIDGLWLSRFFIHHLTRKFLRSAFCIRQDLQGVFFRGWSVADVESYIRFCMNRPEFAQSFFTYFSVDSADDFKISGHVLFEHRLEPFSPHGLVPGFGRWLFMDDGVNGTWGAYGVATRSEVFQDWSLIGSLRGAPDPTLAATDAHITQRDLTPPDMYNLRAWNDLIRTSGREEMERVLVESCKQDPSVFRELIRSPSQVIQRVFGVKIPEGYRVRVIQELPRQIVIRVRMDEKVKKPDPGSEL